MPAYSPDRYTGDGSTTDFSVTFEYGDDPDNLRVTVDGVEQTIDTDYTLPDDSTVRFTTAPESDAYIMLQLYPSFAARPNDWQDSDTLTETNHNEEDNEGFWRDQYLLDARGLPRSEADGHWDGQDPTDGSALRISNINDPVSPTDVVNLRTLNSRLGGGSAGSPGVWRETGTGDGLTTTVTLVSSSGAALTDKDVVYVFFDGALIPTSDYSLSGNGKSVVFENPIPNGTYYEIVANTNAVTDIADGGLTPPVLTLTDDYMIVGDSSNLGEAVAMSSVSLSSFAAPTAAISMGSQRVTSVATPTASTDAATKGYVDTEVAAAGAFNTTSDPATSLTLDTAYQNSTSNTEIVIVRIYETNTISNDRRFELQYADDSGFTTNRKTVAWSTFPPQFEEMTAVGFVPAGKYWRLTETTGSSVTSFSFYYGKAGA